MAEIWMDDYKEFLYFRDPPRYKIDVGDISKEVALKKQRNCKPFQYYLDEIAPDLVKNFPLLISYYVSGAIKLIGTSLCLDSFQRGLGESVGLYPCNSDLMYPQGAQNFEINSDHDLHFKNSEKCLDGTDLLIMKTCVKKPNMQIFFYDPDSQHLVYTSTGKCAEGDPADRLQVKLKPCDLSNTHQKWLFGMVNRTAIATWRKESPNLLATLQRG